MPEELTRCCDLVMKGGLSSGVVFPGAIVEAARRYHLVGIGGTSAGAIAACLAAAAEYRRRTTGSFDGFNKLEEISRELGSDDRLFDLFRPDRETRRLFDKFLKLVSGKAGMGAKLNLGLRLLIAPEKTLGPLVANGFGLCSGMAIGNPSKEPPLTQWLADQIDTISGKQGGPLTFDDLHAAPVPAGIQNLLGESPKRSIDLRCVTTCLTFGRPVEFPFSEKIFAFDPAEWSRLFPARIVDHLKTEAQKILSEANGESTLTEGNRLPLPLRALPVVVAARMSLSFPVLFSAVPLWARNFELEQEPLERAWFSDGGITSNFPLHRFDALHPAWPTLGINLQYEPRKGDGPGRRRLRKEGTFIFMPQRRQEGARDLFRRFARGGPALGDLGGFLGAVFASAKDWHDNAFLKLPGFRDRVAEIWLEAGRGGLNLEMEEDEVQALIDRGRETGRALAGRFADTPPQESMSWEGHRWVRFRSSMAGLMEAILQFKESVDSPMAGDRPLLEMLDQLDAPPTSRFKRDAQRIEAREITEALLALAAKIQASAACAGREDADARPFCEGPAPR